MGTKGSPVRVVGAGIGSLFAVPAGSTNGTALGVKPADAAGVRFYLGASDTVTGYFASAAAGSAPSTTVTFSGANGPAWDENLGDSMNFFVTSKTGSPVARYY